MFYFALVITSPTILPTFVLPVNSSSSSSPPSSSLWSSLPSCLTGGEVYSLATQFDSGHWQMSCFCNNSSTLFCSFCQRVICVALPLYFLSFLLFDCCVMNSTLDDRCTPRALSHTLSSYQVRQALLFFLEPFAVACLHS